MQENNQTENQAQDQQNSAEENKQQEQKIDSKELKISELEAKVTDLNDKLLRTLAELDNVRRRSREELEKSAKFAISNFAADLVVVAENFFLASGNAPKEEIEKSPSVKNYADAIVMTEKELLKVLEKNQVKRINPINEKFDHNFHEAIAQIESDAEEGTVVQVIQAGYSIENRLIRPALVGVAKAKN
ncbi:MAG: nucleotide exchange factor GrpE [Pelagibacterales bacterium]|nr:nucleotide exchange factor GrpE [Pelagibacterales bacterium]